MATLSRQMTVTMKDRVGALADLTEKVKGAGVNILALCAWVQNGTGHLLMLTDDNRAACQAIQSLVGQCREDEVISLTLPNTPGALNEAARKLADAGIGIELAYASAGEALQSAIVLKTTDNARAAGLV